MLRLRIFLRFLFFSLLSSLVVFFLSRSNDFSVIEEANAQYYGWGGGRWGRGRYGGYGWGYPYYSGYYSPLLYGYSTLGLGSGWGSSYYYPYSSLYPYYSGGFRYLAHLQKKQNRNSNSNSNSNTNINDSNSNISSESSIPRELRFVQGQEAPSEEEIPQQHFDGGAIEETEEVDEDLIAPQIFRDFFLPLLVEEIAIRNAEKTEGKGTTTTTVFPILKEREFEPEREERDSERITTTTTTTASPSLVLLKEEKDKLEEEKEREREIAKETETTTLPPLPALEENKAAAEPPLSAPHSHSLRIPTSSSTILPAAPAEVEEKHSEE